jgi:hypothetical protein
VIIITETKGYKVLEWIPVEDLILNPDNAKDHNNEQLEAIAKSVEAHDWGRPLIISKDNYILAGNGTYRAVTEILDYKIVPCVRMKWNHDDPEAISYSLADNKIPEMADWNHTNLELNFEKLKLKKFNLELTGFKDTELQQIQTGEYSHGADAGNYGDEDYRKEEFNDLIDKFEEGTPTGEKNARWLYIEYYKDEAKWDELFELLQPLLKGKHDLNREWFYEFIMKHRDELNEV